MLIYIGKNRMPSRSFFGIEENPLGGLFLYDGAIEATKILLSKNLKYQIELISSLLVASNQY